jgi:hypothetical protein
MNYVLTAVFAFIFGFLLGWNISVLFTFLFWLGVGYVGCVLLDACMGLGARACAARSGLRGAFDAGANWYRHWHLRRMLRRYPHLRAIVVPQR